MMARFLRRLIISNCASRRSTLPSSVDRSASEVLRAQVKTRRAR